MFTITVRNGELFYRAQLTHRQYMRHDNGAMVSCGLTVGRDGFRESTLARWIKAGTAREITREDWQHSSCQSSCIRRGATACRW
jgi:GH24 family phage-related lysozyme (muramidase)